jgi:hypothetical protein
VHSFISGIIGDYEGMWRSIAAVAVIAFLTGVVIELREQLWKPQLAARRLRRALPRLDLTLPGFEETITSQGGRRWSEGRGGPGQPVNDRVGRPRVEPTFDKPVR